MSSMFGSQTTKNEIPAYAEDTSKQALGMANARNEMGYIPYMGPDVAAFNPMQKAGMQGANTMAASMGLGTAAPSFMEAQDFGGGVMGHSSQPLYQANMDALEAANPELFAALRALTQMTSQDAMGQAPGAAMRGENPFQPGGFAGDGMGPNNGRTGQVGNGDIGRAISDMVGNATGGRFGGAGTSNGVGKGPGSQGSIW